METQNISETLEEGSVECKPFQNENLDGKTPEEVSALSRLSESCAGSKLVTDIPLSECVDVLKKLANEGDNVDLEGVEFEQKVLDGRDNADLEGVESEKKLENVDEYNDLEGVEVEKKFADVDENNAGVDSEEKLVDGQGGVESEKKLENVDNYNDVEGVELENNFGDVDDAIDLEALGLENGGVAFENLMEGETLEHETQALGSIIPETNKTKDGDVLGAEFNESLLNGGEEVDMVDAAETISNVHANGSLREVQFSGDGISLTVDVFGPLDGFYPVHNLDGQVLGDSGSDSMLSMKNDSPMAVNGNEAEVDASDNQEYNFAVGDLVWVKLKTDLWWPGMICDPSTSKDAGKCDHRGFFFVKYFGNTKSGLCQPFQLKPFLDYFEHMSRQNKSRSFYGAIEKALGEIGRRVKQKMTCSCFSKENQVAAQNLSKEKHSVFSASQFEPANLLNFIRLRALDLCSPGCIEFTVNESYLSAFNCSMGHKQLPVYKLRPTNNAKDISNGQLCSGDSVLKSCKSDSDDRKTTEVEMSGSLESPIGMGSMISCSETANGSAGGKSEKGFESRERKKSKYLSYPYVNSWSRKNSLGQEEDETEDHEGVSLGGIKSPSSPSMVTTPIGKCSNSLRKPRKSVNDNGICHNNVGFAAASSAEVLQELRLTALDCFSPSQSTSSIPIKEFYLSFRIFRNPEVEVQMDEINEATLGCQETFGSPLGTNTSDNQVKGHLPPSAFPKKRGRKKIEDTNATALTGSVETGTDTLKKGIVGKKKKKTATAAVIHHEIGVLGGLPDLNGNNTGLSVESMQVIGPAPTQGKLEPKRRKRKKEELVSEIGVLGGLPDLNGQVTDPNLKGKDFAELSSVTIQDKPKRKRRRTSKSAIGIPNHNGDHNTLLLNFGLGSPVPSKEYITATFSRFGSLVESKTQFLDDSTAQVVFVNDCDAIEALQNLQSRNLFGPALVSYRLRHVSTSNNTQTSLLPADVLKPPAALSGAVPSNGEGPDLVVIKQNLEAMTTMLEKAGDNISPEMRAKLESEVKSFLKKVSSMVGSSSS
ncbi:serine/threonine-protein kinase ATM [Nicotiana tabacum]|uniref:Uncharacterized protein isoform X1 n=2 Tax=Nicotiana TaxID=4085 RepID=A0A1S4CEL1_TOBAC|nr:PREDICTED: uncharacterized protein LOC104216109 [Nicotiana sylvestris]XP_016499550.1 PREDICTED: uncharacterized protein LOC107818123 isoform X1 [Nicotiana tabacum]XP_016499551.1 PREDICTED: uncharacterized protein LOC107818123 isoform X2 [Nicotiana tabacum]